MSSACSVQSRLPLSWSNIERDSLHGFAATVGLRRDLGHGLFRLSFLDSSRFVAAGASAIPRPGAEFRRLKRHAAPLTIAHERTLVCLALVRSDFLSCAAVLIELDAVDLLDVAP